MKVLKYIYLPVPTIPTIAYRPVLDLRPTPTVVFELTSFETTDFFYECQQGNGCRGAGCPPFPRVSAEVPEYVLDHLKRHVELCEGVKRPNLAFADAS